MLPYDKNLFRSGPALTRSLEALDDVWAEIADHVDPRMADPLRAREAAGLAAAARWCAVAALTRNESRGLHQRTDAPAMDPRLARRLRLRGIDRVLVLPERTAEPMEDAACSN
jgi:succinate dehydrogenase/fumarate reductase flavoprotein subunit